MRLSSPLAFGTVLLSFIAAWPPGLNSVKVTVLDATGTAQSSVQVIILGTAMGAITNGSGVAVLSSVPPGLRTFRALRPGFESCWTRDVNVPETGTIEVTLACVDVVDVPGATSSPLIGLLDFSIGPAGASACTNDSLLTGTGRLVIPGNAAMSSSTGTPCYGAALLLAKDRAPLYANSGMPWTGLLGDVYSAAMSPVKLNVAIRVIISDPSLTTAQKTSLESEIRDVHLALAGTLLDDSYTGIALVDDESSGGDPLIQDNNAVASLLSGGCLAAESIRANTSIYDARRINVYYVKSVSAEDGSSGKAGYTCLTSDAPNIIFVDSQEHAPYTLVHEIGHALGLSRPDWGHSQDYEGFYTAASGQKLNVMAETSALPSGVRYLSVGQVAEMHLGLESWLNRADPVDASTVRTRQAGGGAAITTSCGCPETASTNDCAPLKKDIVRAGMAQGPASWLMACTVTAPSTATLCANKTFTMDAKFFTSTGTATSSGTVLWVSLKPSVVTAAAISKSGNTTQGKLTGVSAGTAIVRVYVDGSYVPVTVAVTPPC